MPTKGGQQYIKMGPLLPKRTLSNVMSCTYCSRKHACTLLYPPTETVRRRCSRHRRWSPFNSRGEGSSYSSVSSSNLWEVGQPQQQQEKPQQQQQQLQEVQDGDEVTIRSKRQQWRRRRQRMASSRRVAVRAGRKFPGDGQDGDVVLAPVATIRPGHAAAVGGSSSGAGSMEWGSWPPPPRWVESSLHPGSCIFTFKDTYTHTHTHIHTHCARHVVVIPPPRKCRQKGVLSLPCAGLCGLQCLLWNSRLWVSLCVLSCSPAGGRHHRRPWLDWTPPGSPVCEGKRAVGREARVLPCAQRCDEGAASPCARGEDQQPLDPGRLGLWALLG